MGTPKKFPASALQDVLLAASVTFYRMATAARRADGGQMVDEVCLHFAVESERYRNQLIGPRHQSIGKAASREWFDFITDQWTVNDLVKAIESTPICSPDWLLHVRCLLDHFRADQEDQKRAKRPKRNAESRRNRERTS